MNKFFKKNKSTSPVECKKTVLCFPEHLPCHNLSASGQSINFLDISSDNTEKFTDNLTVPKPVKRSRTLSFDGVLKTLNQLSSLDLFLKVPSNDRRSSCGDSNKRKNSSETNFSLSNSINPIFCSSKSPPTSKCVHCVHLVSLPNSHLKSPEASSDFSFTSSNKSDSFLSDFSDCSDLREDSTTCAHRRSPPIIIHDASLDQQSHAESPPTDKTNLTVEFQSSAEDLENHSDNSFYECSWQEAESLQVPMLKPRSSSLDATPHATTSQSNNSDTLCVDNEAIKQQRSASVDVKLPTAEVSNYMACFDNCKFVSFKSRIKFIYVV